jgi:hypothetical protein
MKNVCEDIVYGNSVGIIDGTFEILLSIVVERNEINSLKDLLL